VYGVIGAIVMRALMISIGSVLISRFDFIFYIFGAFLLWTAWSMLRKEKEAVPFMEKPIVKWLHRHLPFTDRFHEEHFTTVEHGKRFFTPLFLVLILIEISDLIFAIDSVPAVFAITTDPFIVFTSNIFAILGLRALYFLLAGLMNKFTYLKTGLAIILGFIGLKMLLHSFVKIPVGVTLIFILVVLCIVMLLGKRRVR
jgi:tellurite resistance protein TerC